MNIRKRVTYHSFFGYQNITLILSHANPLLPHLQEITDEWQFLEMRFKLSHLEQ